MHSGLQGFGTSDTSKQYRTGDHCVRPRNSVDGVLLDLGANREAGERGLYVIGINDASHQIPIGPPARGRRSRVMILPQGVDQGRADRAAQLVKTSEWHQDRNYDPRDQSLTVRPNPHEERHGQCLRLELRRFQASRRWNSSSVGVYFLRQSLQRFWPCSRSTFIWRAVRFWATTRQRLQGHRHIDDMPR